MSAFPQTYWSLIQRGVADNRSALNRIARDYVDPVRKFIRHSGFTAEDAEDLAQEVFLIVCSPEFLRQADVRKGKFRTLLLLVTKNVMNGEWRKRFAKKRRGKTIALDGETIAEILAAPETSDEGFDREWWTSLLDSALGRLRKENPRRHEILNLHKTHGRPHSEIAKALATTSDHVNNEIRAAKKRVREVLLELVRDYCSTRGEFDEELAQFRRVLGG